MNWQLEPLDTCRTVNLWTMRSSIGPLLLAAQFAPRRNGTMDERFVHSRKISSTLTIRADDPL
jgi:hypothetical protein